MVGVPGVIRTYRKDNWGNLDTGVPTVAETFKKGGYHTALIGKWHLGLEGEAIPTECGFDFFKGWLGDMMDDYYKHRRHGVPYMREGTGLIKPEGHATDLFTSWSADYLFERSKKKDEPFFLFLSYNAPHTPIQPPADWLEKVKEREQGIDDKRAKLVALIEHLDHGIGLVMKCLAEYGLAEDTLVVFTSDNGGQGNVGANNGANRGAKQEMWEGGIRVPTCVVWPGKAEAGRRLDSVTMTMDWLPTLAEAARDRCARAGWMAPQSSRTFSGRGRLTQAGCSCGCAARAGSSTAAASTTRSARATGSYSRTHRTSRCSCSTSSPTRWRRRRSPTSRRSTTSSPRCCASTSTPAGRSRGSGSSDGK